jgi:hypothetical protein
MKKLLLATAALAAAAMITMSAARADWIGAGAGAGTGLLVAGPIGAVAGGVIGGVWGRPFWGPPIAAAATAGPTTICIGIAGHTGKPIVAAQPAAQRERSGREAGIASAFFGYQFQPAAGQRRGGYSSLYP